jgi:hypothetical protein
MVGEEVDAGEAAEWDSRLFEGMQLAGAMGWLPAGRAVISSRVLVHLGQIKTVSSPGVKSPRPSAW